MIRGLPSFVVAVFMSVSRCAAQTPDSSHSDGLALLTIPDGQTIACHVPEADPADPRAANAVEREFRFGSPTASIASWPREITVLFDSAGHPLVLSDEVSHAPRGSESLTALFRPDGQVTGKSMVITVDSASMANAKARGDLVAAMAAIRPPVSRELSASEAARVRMLAAWLWERRCGRERK